MVEIYFRGVGSTLVKRIDVPQADAERAIRMIEESDTLEYGYSYQSQN